MKSIYLKEDLKNLADYLHENNFGGSTILITGATGLIGSLCIKAIIEYNDVYHFPIQVIALARNKEKTYAIFEDEFEGKDYIKNINFIYQDIKEQIPDDIKSDYIIHTANSTSSQYFIKNPVEVIESIYIGTKRVLDYGLKNKVKGIVYLSSMEVFGEVKVEERITEENLGYLNIQNVRSCYSEGKRIAELLCMSYAVEYNLSVRVARLAQTFGAGINKSENRVFAQFARSAINGENILLHTKGESTGNYCYTTDAIKAIFLLLIKGNKGEPYTVVNEETTRSIAEMAYMVATKFSNGKSQLIFDIPKENIFGYAPVTKMRLSSKKLRDLGWEAKISLEEMYKRMIPDL